MKLVVYGFVVHIVFLLSVFDIYFKSPIIHGLKPLYPNSTSAPAKRLVLFVADGLRADSFCASSLTINDPYKQDDTRTYNAPYLRSIMKERGAWGVSHTRVPTESRPGHVALIAGVYEDPSAITKGWKENPVEFDSVFNESQYTFSWGSPDILTMFAKGAHRNHVRIETYSAAEEDFASSDASQLDTWVFNHVYSFLQTVKQNQTLHSQVTSDGVVFFLHLLGLDTNGHSAKPNSRTYIDNIKLVDEGVKRIEQMIEDVFNHDGKTAFVFTADHGMTDWGSHGAGDVHETETPLIAWGSGIRKPIPLTEPDTTISPFHWKVDGFKRSDVMQADIAPLMAGLIGVPFPLNSVGRLPLDYLDVSLHDKAAMWFLNTKQLTSQFLQLKQITEEVSISLLYRPYPQLNNTKLKVMTDEILHLIDNQQYEEAIELSTHLFELSILGLDYFHRYHQYPLLLSISLAFLGWLSYLSYILFIEYAQVIQNNYYKTINHMKTDIVFGCVGSVVGLVLFAQHSPLLYYIYYWLPIILWWKVTRHGHVFISVWKEYQIKWISILISLVLLIFGVEILVLSFFYREVLSIGLVVIALWPLSKSTVNQINFNIRWTLSCILLAAFPLIPVLGSESSNHTLVSLSGWLSLFVGVGFTWYQLFHLVKQSRNQLIVTIIQFVCIPVSIWIKETTRQTVLNKQGLLTGWQVAAWGVTVVSLLLPFFGSKQVPLRLLQVSIGLLPPFLLLSLGHEGFFFLMLIITMASWITIEADDIDKNDEISLIFMSTSTHGEKSLSKDDLRKAYFFLFFILLSFFGTGNIASVNSFDPTAVHCFLTVFSPFIMGFLLLVKIIIPFLIVSCAFHAILVILQIPPRKLLLMILFVSDIAGLHFFHLVTNQGSWLEIGSSLSHFVIMEVTVLFVCVLHGLSYLYTTYSLSLLFKYWWMFIKSRNKILNSTMSSIEAGDKQE